MSEHSANGKDFKDKSRRLARESYWQTHDRDSYHCPDCGRSEDEITGKFEVHHKNGQPLDNRPENRVALCRLCHNLREGKKPSIEAIKQVRNAISTQPDEQERSGRPSVYLAGSMDRDSAEHDTWRASILECEDRGDLQEYTGQTQVEINSPTEVTTSHGAGVVKDVAGRDMQLIDESDAILAYFEKTKQPGTLTELVYAVSQGMPALVLFNEDLSGYSGPHDAIADGVEMQFNAPTYWFLINFLTGDGWKGLEADVTVRRVQSRDEIKHQFEQWGYLRCGLCGKVPDNRVVTNSGKIQCRGCSRRSVAMELLQGENK